MSGDNPMASSDGAPSRIYAGPTKRFFVDMLTRDIELRDAILDLLDNCVDGAMRTNRDNLGEEQPYDGFIAKITITPENFRLEDNCGGIPGDRVKHAFMLGRPDIELDADLPTVGMYGIGMKRAIFKMGRNAQVKTKSRDGNFSVHYTPEWLEVERENASDDPWMLNVSNTDNDIDGYGTHIVVEELRPGIITQFSPDSSFIDELRDAISKYYGFIMERGFQVEINNELVEPVVLKMHAVEVMDPQSKAIAPYVYTGRVQDVDIFISVGFYRPPPKASEVEEEQEAAISSEEAGITIICNDRVVLHNDRSRTTGWGEQGTPKYHNQFSAIAGQAVFSSNNAKHLPLTTTKRGLEVDSEAYWVARKYLIEGIKSFTRFTNKWKGIEEETAPEFQKTQRVTAKAFKASIARNMKPVRDESQGNRFIPNLPMPSEDNPYQRISFRKEKDKIRTLSRYIFDDADIHPSRVGEACFDKALEEIEE